MSSVIYKYPIRLGEIVTVRNGNVIHFGADARNDLCAWVQHTDGDNSTTKLYIVGTGAPFDELHIAHCSYVDSDGYVWHLIEEWN